ncbi:MAG TPA: hypothetical protein DCS66_16735 [Flavobacteriaceae bacterium]|nr:hypothetical protein [Flavobacteriaceae bacterium]|tara:strand:+ start:269 stop:949 length:681 start_codon:yes stop_codon:yes gene_type:complete
MKTEASLLKNNLLDSLIPVFSKYGFQINKKESAFKRVSKDSIQIFDFFIYKKNNQITIKSFIKIKITKIEDLYRRIVGDKDRPYMTLGNNVLDIVEYQKNEDKDKFEKKPLPKWLIENAEDVSILTKLISNYLEDFILVYFNKFSSIQSVDRLLNENPKEISVHNYIYPLRSCIAILAAKINSNENFINLVKIYEEEMKNAEEPYKSDFIKIKEYLINNYTNDSYN